MSSIAGKFVNPLTDFGSSRISRKWLDAAEVAKLSTEERQAYETSLKYYRDLKNVVDTSREEGIEEGVERGIEIGTERGIEIGKEEGSKAMTLKIAKAMKDNRITPDLIAQTTGLSLEEISRL